MFNLKNFFGAKSFEEKVASYISSVKELSAINKLAKTLADDFSIQKSRLDTIAMCSEERGNEIMKSFREFVDIQKTKVNELAKQRESVLKSIEKAEKDKDLTEVVKEVKAIRSAYDLYNSGKITKSFCFELIKSKQGKINFADIIVRNPEGKILVLNRIKSDGSSEGWGIPGGHVELGEDSKEAAKRELQEETELIVDIDKLQKVGEYKDKDIHIDYYEVWLEYEDFINQPIIMDSTEHSAYEWVEMYNLEDYPWTYEDMCKNLKKILMPWEKNRKVEVISKAYIEGEISESIYKSCIDKIKDEDVEKSYISQETRRKLAEEGKALPDGSYPIRDIKDLRNAILTVGLGKSEKKAKKWIIKRAKELDAVSELPESWGVEKACTAENQGHELGKESLEGGEDEKKNIEKAVDVDTKKNIDDVKDGGKESLKKVLYRALAEEFLAWYQYYIVHAFMAGKQRESTEKTFVEQAKDELDDHAGKLIQRISELDGDIAEINDPRKWFDLSQARFFPPKEPYDVETLIDENIKSEEDAIKRYKEIASITQDNDPTTYLMSMEILKDEEEHLRALEDFKADLKEGKKEE